jgi:hypothetical protein
MDALTNKSDHVEANGKAFEATKVGIVLYPKLWQNKKIDGLADAMQRPV